MRVPLSIPVCLLTVLGLTTACNSGSSGGDSSVDAATALNATTWELRLTNVSNANDTDTVYANIAVTGTGMVTLQLTDELEPLPDPNAQLNQRSFTIQFFDTQDNQFVLLQLTVAANGGSLSGTVTFTHAVTKVKREYLIQGIPHGCSVTPPTGLWGFLVFDDANPLEYVTAGLLDLQRRHCALHGGDRENLPAEPWVYEPFDYFDPFNPIPIMTGGKGLDDTLTYISGEVLEDSLKYENLDRVGGHVRMPSGRAYLESSLAGTTTAWFSFTVRFDSATFPFAPYTAGLDLGSNASPSWLGVGAYYDASFTKSYWGLWDGFGLTTALSSLEPEVDETYLLVVRIELRPGNDLFELYVDPTAGHLPAAPDATLSSVDVSVVEWIDFINAYMADIDEIRMGPTFESVTPYDRVTMHGTMLSGLWDGMLRTTSSGIGAAAFAGGFAQDAFVGFWEQENQSSGMIERSGSILGVPADEEELRTVPEGPWTLEIPGLANPEKGTLRHENGVLTLRAGGTLAVGSFVEGAWNLTFLGEHTGSARGEFSGAGGASSFAGRGTIDGREVAVHADASASR